MEDSTLPLANATAFLPDGPEISATNASHNPTVALEDLGMTPLALATALEESILFGLELFATLALLERPLLASLEKLTLGDLSASVLARIKPLFLELTAKFAHLTMLFVLIPTVTCPRLTARACVAETSLENSAVSVRFHNRTALESNPSSLRLALAIVR